MDGWNGGWAKILRVREWIEKISWKCPGPRMGCRAISRSRSSNINLIEKFQNVVKFMANVSHTAWQSGDLSLIYKLYYLTLYIVTFQFVKIVYTDRAVNSLESLYPGIKFISAFLWFTWCINYILSTREGIWTGTATYVMRDEIIFHGKTDIQFSLL